MFKFKCFAKKGQESPEQIELVSRPDSPIRLSVKTGNIQVLETLLAEGADLSSEVSQQFSRSLLHEAAELRNHRSAIECTRALLRSSYFNGKDNKWFIDLQDQNGETALHIAARNEHQDMVLTLARDEAAGLEIRCKKGITPMQLIFSKVSLVMKSILDQAVEISGGKTDDFDLEIEIDIGYLIGFPSSQTLEGNEFRELLDETSMLSYALLEKSSESVLQHPVVQLFLHMKKKRLKYLLWTSTIFHISWVFLYTFWTTNLYIKDCPPLDTSGTNRSADECNNISYLTYISAWLLLFFNAIALGKNVYKLWVVKEISPWLYFRRVENSGQWTLVLVTFLTIWPTWISDRIRPWMYETSAFGVLIAGAIFVSRLGKVPRVQIYVQMYAKALTSFLYVAVAFVALLAAFSISIKILSPEEPTHRFPLKILAMMIGELEITDTLENEKSPLMYPISAHIVYAIFIISSTILLLNLLIGITISDIQKLRDEVEFDRLPDYLERIYVIEHFILTKCIKYVFGNSFLETFMVLKLRDVRMKKIVPLSLVPYNLREKIRELVIRNKRSTSQTERAAQHSRAPENTN